MAIDTKKSATLVVAICTCAAILLAVYWHSTRLIREWNEVEAGGRAAMNRGDLPEAIRLFSSGQVLAAHFGSDDIRLADSSCALAEALGTSQKFLDAISPLQQCLEIRKVRLSPADASIIRVMSDLAVTNENLGRLAESEQLLNSAIQLSIRSSSQAIADSDLVEKLARIYSDEGKLKDAEALYTKILAKRKEMYGLHTPHDAELLRGLGNVFSDQGNFEKADEAYLQALAIDEKSTGRTGIKVGNDLVDLAESYRAQKRYAEAEPLYRRVLAIWENSDVSPIDRASLLNNMCIFQWSKHDFHRATVTCDQALKLWKSVLGDSSPSIAAIYQNAANAHRDVGDYDVAERLYDSALAIWNKPGDDGRAATVLISKAQMYASQGNLGKAEELVEESIAHLDSSGPVASSLDASGRIEIYLKGASIMEHRNSALALLLKSKAKALGYKDQ